MERCTCVYISWNEMYVNICPFLGPDGAPTFRKFKLKFERNRQTILSWWCISKSKKQFLAMESCVLPLNPSNSPIQVQYLITLFPIQYRPFRFSSGVHTYLRGSGESQQRGTFHRSGGHPQPSLKEGTVPSVTGVFRKALYTVHHWPVPED